LNRFPTYTGWMIPFDAAATPQGLAHQLLRLADPIPTLEAWLPQGPAQLAPMLHALVAELATGPTPSPIQAVEPEPTPSDQATPSAASA